LNEAACAADRVAALIFGWAWLEVARPWKKGLGGGVSLSPYDKHI
jgi:hypothetical protein